LSFFVMVLCHSRMLYVEFSLAETMEHFLAAHQHAFEFFRGVPQQVIPDYVARHIIDVLFPPAICALRRPNTRNSGEPAPREAT
jgi:transposase